MKKMISKWHAEDAALCFLFSASLLLCMGRARALNPDTDVLHLVTSGRDILSFLREGGPSPFRENLHNLTSGLGIQIQYPLCAVLNAAWCDAFGLSRMWVLAAIESAVLAAISLASFRYVSGSMRRAALCSSLLTGFAFSDGLVTTRPYQLTVAACVLAASILTKQCGEPRKRPWGRVATFGAVSSFLSNYESAMLLLPALFLLAFCIGARKDERTKRMKDAALFAGAYLIFGSLNPSGLRAFSYLPRSLASVYKVGIAETAPTYACGSSFVVFAVLTAAGAVLAVLFLKKESDKAFLLLLFLGSVASGAFAVRNVWMTAVGVALLLSKASFPGKVGQIARRFAPSLLVIAAIFAVLLFPRGAAQSGSEKLSSFGLGVLDTAKDLGYQRLFTTFNCGAAAEFAGFDAYIDARPELYAPAFTGGEDRLGEYTRLVSGELTFDYIEEKYHPDAYFLALVSSEDGAAFLAELQGDDRFMGVCHDEGAWLFVRRKE